MIGQLMHRALLRFTHARPAKMIAPGNTAYMVRYYVGQWHGWTLYLHQFVSADAERHLHNHPYDHAFAVVLRGRYVEERLRRLCPVHGMVCKTRTIRWFNRLEPSAFHRITRPERHTWTLFAFRRSPTYGWGFLNRLAGGLVRYRGFGVGDGSAGGDGWWKDPDALDGGHLRDLWRLDD